MFVQWIIKLTVTVRILSVCHSYGFIVLHCLFASNTASNFVSCKAMEKMSLKVQTSSSVSHYFCGEISWLLQRWA